MRKVKYYTGPKGNLVEDSWNFHLNAVSRLQDGTATKSIVQGLEGELKSQFRDYAEKFTSNTLERLQPIDLQETDDAHPKRDTLQNQYSFKKKVFVELFRQLSSDEKGRKSALCPNCQAEDSHTLDHCLPKTEFPEFCDNPLNLMLCCQDCNGHKGSAWRKNGRRTQLNLYLDEIPDIQYLFVTVTMVNGLPVAKYEVRQTAGIDNELWEKIRCHYGKPLNLCKVKYVEKTYDTLSELRTALRPAYEKLPESEAKAALIETVGDMQAKYGRNYWKALLLEACAANPVSWAWFMTKEENVNPQVDRNCEA